MSLTSYFERRAQEVPAPKFNPFDRVFGHHNKIPFIGSVVREQQGNVIINTDLPVKVDNEYKSVIIVELNKIKLLTEH